MKNRSANCNSGREPSSVLSVLVLPTIFVRGTQRMFSIINEYTWINNCRSSAMPTLIMVCNQWRLSVDDEDRHHKQCERVAAEIHQCYRNIIKIDFVYVSHCSLEMLYAICYHHSSVSMKSREILVDLRWLFNDGLVNCSFTCPCMMFA